MKPAKIKPLTGEDGAAVTGNMVLTGVVRTSKGYAVCKVVVSPTTETCAFALGNSQAHKEFVAREHLRVVTREALKA